MLVERVVEVDLVVEVLEEVVVEEVEVVVLVDLVVEVDLVVVVLLDVVVEEVEVEEVVEVVVEVVILVTVVTVLPYISLRSSFCQTAYKTVAFIKSGLGFLKSSTVELIAADSAPQVSISSVLFL